MFHSDPCRCMVTCILIAAHDAIDTAGFEARGKVGREKKMVDAKSDRKSVV